MSNNPQPKPPCLGEGNDSPTVIPFIIAVVVLVVTAIVFAIKQWKLGSAVHERNVLLEEKKQKELAIKEGVEKEAIDGAVIEILRIKTKIAKLDDKLAKTRIAHVDLEAQLDKVKSWSDLNVH